MLPDDRADVLYHRYDGGGVTIDGPSLLVRKKFAEKYGVTANYYIDMVSSASIDVVTTASPYKEERTQGSLAFDMLNGKSQYSLSFTNSEENDYTANSLSFDVSQDMFGDLTTVSFGFSRGWDEVRKRGDDVFVEPVDRRTYRVGVSQIVTPSPHDGALVRARHRRGLSQQPLSLGPLSRSGKPAWLHLPARGLSAHSHQQRGHRCARYFLPYRAAVSGEYRYFTDTWGIGAHTAEVDLHAPVDASGGYSSWGCASTPRTPRTSTRTCSRSPTRRTSSARDKELSTFSNQMLSLGATYELPLGWKFLKRSTLSFFYDRMQFQYDDFRDLDDGRSARRRGTLRVRRERVPFLLLRLVLKSRAVGC